MRIQKVVLTLVSFLAIVAFALMPLASVATAAPPERAQQQESEYVPGELIVGFVTHGREGSSLGSANVSAAARTMRAEIANTAEDGSFVLLRFKSEADAQANIAVLSALQGVAYVERNGILRIPPMPKGREGFSSEAFNPNDPGIGLQWHLDKILYHLAPAPETTNVPCIVVIDTGVDYTHPDLAGKVYKGRDFIDNDSDPMDVLGPAPDGNPGHGTHVSGLAAGVTNNSTGIAGVSPKSHILAVRVLDEMGSGTWAQVANGILWANKATSAHCGGQDPKIYNMSLGGYGASASIANAIAAAKAKGRMVIVAAGNENWSKHPIPGADPNAYAVGATDNNDNRASFSNFGVPGDAWVEIAAPGFQDYSTVMGPDYEAWNGTSMATPIVAGAAARIWSKYPTFTPDQVMARLQNTGDPTYGFTAPIKRINLLAALGGVARYTIQGQIFDAVAVAPLTGAIVTVKQGATVICTLSTGTDGDYPGGAYACIVPASGTYTVQAKKSGYIPLSKNFNVTKRTFNANLSLSPTNSPSTSNDWTITTLWKGWQPYESVGKELDLWVVKPGATPKCYGPAGTTTSVNIIPGGNSWNFWFGQTEAIRVQKAFGGTIQVWLAVNKEGSDYPFSTHITGSGARMDIYKNNVLVKKLIAPSTPTTGNADLWYVGDINLNTNTFTLKNLIRTDAKRPGCMDVTVD